MWLRKSFLVVDSQECNKLINKENLFLPLHACGELLGYNACAKLLNLLTVEIFCGEIPMQQ